ncbi:hypothetical protein TNCV_1876771 [Trichonephila clavipes]|nr:hypothetical protein TNCV_1876771 [Trichonephila clavipes]
MSLTLADKVTTTPKVQFQVLVPYPKTHPVLTFSAPAHVSSTTRENQNPDPGLECIPSYPGNILQSYKSFWNLISDFHSLLLDPAGTYFWQTCAFKRSPWKEASGSHPELSGSFAMPEKGGNHLVPGPYYMVDALKLPNQALGVPGKSLQTCVA